ncbi:hypothetical protein [uncultured Gammaproteobacteria bacterium]|nr:hypothetical protein [uncultured Gammaproteobacteria bacterium]
MQQNYHVNANTNSHSRAIIHRAKTSNIALAQRLLNGEIEILLKTKPQDQRQHTTT